MREFGGARDLLGARNPGKEEGGAKDHFRRSDVAVSETGVPYWGPYCEGILLGYPKP